LEDSGKQQVGGRDESFNLSVQDWELLVKGMEQRERERERER
jgi:hypothetical protein